MGELFSSFLESILDLFNGQLVVTWAYTVWNTLAGAALALIGQAPSQVADGMLWQISKNLLAVMQVIGASLFTVFFFVNFCKRSSNLRENLTLEVTATLFLQLLLGDLVLLNLSAILDGLIGMGQGLIGIILPNGNVSFFLQPGAVDEWDTDSFIIGLLLALTFGIFCLGCGLLLVFFVYSVYFKIFFFLVAAPLALGTLGGPPGALRSAEAWFKGMLCAVTEFAGMALALRLCAALINSNSFFNSTPDAFLAFETAWNIIQSMLIVLLCTTSAKGAESLIRRAFGF